MPPFDSMEPHALCFRCRTNSMIVASHRAGRPSDDREGEAVCLLLFALPGIASLLPENFFAGAVRPLPLQPRVGLASLGNRGL